MVDVVSTVSSIQSTVLKQNVQNASTASAAPAASNTDTSSTADLVTSGIVMDNLQNVAILEYRSSQTDEVIQQYPNQAQINAFKAAQRLAHQASEKPADVQVVHQNTSTAPAQETHQSAPAQRQAPAPSTAAAPSGSGASGGGKTTSVVA